VPAAAARPEGLPDTYWDSVTNSLKVDPAALVNDLKERDDLKAFKAADDVRRGSLPPSADAYKIELPADFTPPAGVEFKFDENAPELAQAKALAHAKGWTQADFTDALGIFAAAKVGEQAQVATARAAEIAKLGTTAPARVDAVSNWLDAKGYGALKSMLVTAEHVQTFEKMINSTTSQGVATFSQKHRVEPPANEIAGWDKMSFEQRRAAQDNARRAQTR
jgi:hypothetical protein